MIQRFKSESYYLKEKEILEKSAELGVDKYSKDFITDLATHFAGGVPKSRLEMERELSRLAPEILPDKNGKLSGYGREYATMSEFKSKWAKQEYTNKHEPLIDFIHGLPKEESLMGDSPLAKAFNMLKKLEEADGGRGFDTSEPGDPDEKIPSLGKSSAKELSDSVKEDLKLLKTLDDLDKELLKGEDGDTSAFSNMGSICRRILETSQTIKNSSLINAEASVKYIKDPKGSVSFFRASKGLQDLSKAPRKSLMYRKRLAGKLIESKIRIEEKYTKDTSTPLIALLLDKSGSMQSGRDSRNDLKGLGVLWHIVKECQEGRCVGVFSFYETNCLEFVVLDRKKMDLIEWFRSISKTVFDLGGTDVKTSILEALEKIEELEEVYEINSDRKELIVVGDGEDEINGLTVSMLDGAILNAYVLDNDNEELGAVAIASGGVYKNEI